MAKRYEMFLRYYPNGDTEIDAEEANEGFWVRYEDHAAEVEDCQELIDKSIARAEKAEAERDELRAALEIIEDESNGNQLNYAETREVEPTQMGTLFLGSVAAKKLGEAILAELKNVKEEGE